MNSPDDERQALYTHFEENVKKHFGFLSNMFRSVDKKTIGWIVRYTSYKVEVNIYYERLSFEIFLTLNLKNPRISLYLEEIITGSEKRRYRCAVDAAIIEKSVIEMADLLKKYGRSFLAGDAELYNEIKKSRDTREQEFALKNKIMKVEERAKTAWENGNYEEVVTLYQSIKEKLTPIQEKRLSISKKRIAELSNL